MTMKYGKKKVIHKAHDLTQKERQLNKFGNEKTLQINYLMRLDCQGQFE